MGRSACLFDQSPEVFELTLDGVGRRVAALAAATPVVRKDRESLGKVLGPIARWQRAPSTRISGGPSPIRANAIAVPSRDLTVSIMLVPFND